jgi:UDP-N-acetyl-D-mannosaminuronic acid transferase (WecB/TagA/CpsF family)
MQNWERIDARVALTGGAVFDYVSGELRRGPRLLTDNSFEWLEKLPAMGRLKRVVRGVLERFFRALHEGWL